MPKGDEKACFADRRGGVSGCAAKQAARRRLDGRMAFPSSARTSRPWGRRSRLIEQADHEP